MLLYVLRKSDAEEHYQTIHTFSYSRGLLHNQNEQPCKGNAYMQTKLPAQITLELFYGFFFVDPFIIDVCNIVQLIVLK
jgi:hypothetical protein